MTSQWLPKRISDFSRGYIDKVDANELPDGALRDCRNVISRTIGRISSRNGQAKLNSTEIASASIQGLAPYYLSGTKYLLVACNGAVYYCNPPSGTMTQIKTGLDASALVKFVTVSIDGENQIVGFNGVNTPFKWNGTTVADMYDYRTITRGETSTSDNTVYTVLVNGTAITYPLRSGSTHISVWSLVADMQGTSEGTETLINAEDYTVNASAGTITFDTSRVQTVDDIESEDAKTVGFPLNGYFISVHPFLTGCTVTMYDRYGNTVRTFTDDTESDGYYATYAEAKINCPTTGINFAVTDEEMTTEDHLVYNAHYPFKSSITPVVKDKDNNTLSPASIDYENGTVTFSSVQTSVEPLAIAYTANATPLELMPVTTTYQWVDKIYVDCQYAISTLSAQYRYPVTHKGHIFAFGNDERIYFSDIIETGSEYESWPPINNWPINLGKGESDGCMVSMQNELYIFRSRSIHRLRGTTIDDINVIEVVAGIGCSGPNAAAMDESGDLIYFISEQGLYSFNGISATNISRNMIPTLWEGVNVPALSQAAVKVWHGLVLFSLPTQGSDTNNFVLAYDPAIPAFWPWDAMYVTEWTEITTATGTKLYSGNTTEGYVLEQDTGTSDAGTNIAAYFQLPTIDMGDASILKKARDIYVEHGDESVTWAAVFVSKDYASAIEVDAVNASGVVRKYALKPDITGKWRSLDIKLSHSQAGKFDVRSVSIPYKIDSKPKVKGAIS